MQHNWNDTRFIWYLSLIGFFAIFSTTISKNPVLPLFTLDLGGDDLLIGLISAVSPLAGVLFSFPVGVLSDQIGRRRLLLLSGLVFSTAPLLYLVISDPLWLIPIRFFHGLATAILGPVITAVIAGRYSHTKGERLGQYSSATLAGRTLAPFVGGLVLSLLFALPSQSGFRVVYGIAGLTGLLVFVLLFRFKDDDSVQLSPVRTMRFIESFVGFFSDRRLLGAALIDMGTYFAFGAFETFLPVYLLLARIDPWMIGSIFSVQVLVIALTKPLFGKIADHADQRPLIIMGMLFIAVSMLGIPLFHEVTLLFGISIIFGLGMSLSTVSTSTYVGYLAKEGEMGASMGALSSVMDIGHSTGPLMTGMLITLFGFLAGFGFSFLLVLILTLLFTVLSNNKPYFWLIRV